MKRDTRTAYRARARATEALIDAAKAEIAAESKAKFDAARQAAREAENARHKFTTDELSGATHVRDVFGWHQVVRVNTKTVTVRTPYSWDDLIAINKVLEFRVVSHESP